MSRALAAAERALFWALAAIVFATVGAGLGARALYRVAAHYEAQASANDNYAIVRIIAPEGPEAMLVAHAVLDRAPQVSMAQPVSNEQVARLLEDLAGAAVDQADLPQMRLFELELIPEHTEETGPELEAALAESGVTAEIMLSQPGGRDGWSWGRVRQLALWGGLGFAILMALVVTFAARGFAARRRDMIRVMTDLGFTRTKAAGRVADEAASAGFWAGIVGALFAGCAGFLLLLVLTPGMSIADVPTVLAPIDAAPLAAAPLFAAIAASMGARSAAESFYDQAARLG